MPRRRVAATRSAKPSQSGRHRDLLTESALYFTGATASVALPGQLWAVAGFVLPAILLHMSLAKALRLRRQTLEAVEQLADLVDIRDGYTGKHSERVAELAERVARALGCDAGQVGGIRLAARVHDIGKIAIPDRVLHKPTRLDDVEWELMKTHVDAGCQVLERFSDYGAGLELVLAHHERIDGSGYPRGLKGRQVPLGAQVIGIADAIDAMSSDRPYRRALPLSAAIEELERGSGSQFSTEVVAAAFEVLGVRRGSVPVTRLKIREAVG